MVELTKVDFSSQLKNTIESDDVYWTMIYDNEEYRKKYNKQLEEIQFEKPMAIAHLLMNEVLIVNSHYFEKDWPERAQKQTSLYVLCNDVFAWGCSDAEPIFFSEIQDLYDHFLKSFYYGSDVWCCKRRNIMPQKPVYDAIQKDGTFNLDELNLQPNPTWK